MDTKLIVPTMAEISAQGKKPEILFWVGCAGSYDDKAIKITKAFVRILNAANVDFAVLGAEESCTGDVAKRSGNEFLFQMQALKNINTLNNYGIEKIVTTCPHCYNTIKNEYPSLGGNYEVLHHTELIKNLLEDKKLILKDEKYYKDAKVTYHDPCYLGRANNKYNTTRELIKKIDSQLIEMKNNKSHSLCCGAGGGQIFKESEKGSGEINIKRTEEALDTKAQIVVTGCPFCKTMLTDGLKSKAQADNIDIIDIAEMISLNI